MKTRAVEMKPEVLDPALAMDMLAALMGSSGSLYAALDALGTYLPGCQPLRKVATQLHVGVDWDTAWAEANQDPRLAELSQELKFIHVSAVPSASVLQASASTLRRNRKRKAEQLAAELAIRLVLPMGICLLPAFICLGVIPMVYALFPQF